MIENPNPSADVAPSPAPPVRRVARPPTATYILIGITIFFYFMQLLSTALYGAPAAQVDWLEVYGARINESIRAGELWRFITPVFLHGSPLHIFFNMYALLSIGSFMERQFRVRRFLLLYFLSAFSGNVLSFFFGSDNGFSIGASTAVFGLIAAEVVFFYQNRELFGSFARQAMTNAIIIIFVNLFIGLAPGIDNWGHVGGLLGGAIFAWFAGPRWEASGAMPGGRLIDTRGGRDVILGTGLVMVIFGTIAAVGM